eukprot:COSAG04_NODE_4106_length_2296_cov_1.746928_1_plen_285_part_10
MPAIRWLAALGAPPRPRGRFALPPAPPRHVPRPILAPAAEPPPFFLDASEGVSRTHCGLTDESVCCAGSLPAACASCVRPSAGAAAAPSPALAVCSAYNGASCCDLDAELSFTLSVARSRYAGDAACYSEMLDAHCGVECHAEQDAFTDTGTSEVRVCASWCTALHATCGGLDDVEESCTASVTDPVTTCTLNPGVDCSVASGAGTCTRVAPDRSAGSDLASDVWCEGLTIFPWTGTHTTVVVADADHVGACWGGIALDGCDGVPNSGKVFDSCGVCDGDGSSCT